MRQALAAALVAALAGAPPAVAKHDHGSGQGRHHRVRKGPPAFAKPDSRAQVVPPNAPHLAATNPAPPPALTPLLDAKLLIISADGGEVGLPALRQALDYQGTPYTVYIASQTPGGLTASALAGGGRGHYQGVILTTGNLAYFNGVTWTSALNAGEWQALSSYEAEFHVRQATWYTYPTDLYGFEPPNGEVDSTAPPVAATLTAEGARVFFYLNPAMRLPIQSAYAYLAPPRGTTTTVLLEDVNHDALVVVKRYPDGRENLAFTFDNAPYLTHSVALSYGLINWVTRGVFLGYHRVFLSAQVDDVFLPDDIFTGGTFRMTGDDLNKTLAWQQAVRGRPVSGDFRVDMAFNGLGLTPAEAPANDTLATAARAVQGQFKWISHTWSHPDLDVATQPEASQEVTLNNATAVDLALTSYSPDTIITPGVTGLYNPAAMGGMATAGVRYLVSDTSRPGEDNPIQNTGIFNLLQPSVFEIPRRPTNLFYNVSTPAEWAVEYNSLYHAFWGRDLTYQEILDKESDVLAMYMLKGENDPLMFHQPNLRAYDGTNSLMSQLLDRVLAKYSALFTLPVTSPTMKALGVEVSDRTRYSAAGVTATLSGRTLTLTAQQDVVVPVTGLEAPGASLYGGQPITFVQLHAGQSVTIQGPDPQ